MSRLKKIGIFCFGLFFILSSECVQLDITKGDLKLILKAAQTIGKELMEDIEKRVEGRQYTLKEIRNKLPIIKNIPVPRYIDRFLNNIKLRQPEFIQTEDSVELRWVNPLFYGKEKVGFTFRFYAGPGNNDTWGVSFGVGLPGEWALTELVPEVKEKILELERGLIPKHVRDTLKKLNLTVKDFAKIVELLKFENVGYVTSSKFDDPVWGPLKMGSNIFFTIKTEGPLKKLLDLFGQDLTKVRFHGLAAFLLAGSEVRGILGGKFDLLRFPIDRRKPAKFHLRTAEQQLRIGITQRYFPTIKAIGGYELLLPGQKDYIKLLGSIDYMGVKGDVSIYSEGMIENLFGMPGVDVSNLGIVLTLIPAEPFVGGFGATLELHLGKLIMQGVIRLDVTGDMALICSRSGLNQNDFADMVLHFIEAGAKVGKVKANVNMLRPLFYAALPRMERGDFKIYVVPKSIELFDKIYSTGIHSKVSGNFFGLGGGFEGKLSYTGAKGVTYIDSIKVPKRNPVFILTGAGLDGIRGTKDDAIIGWCELSLENQIFFYDALLEIPPLSIKNDVRIKASPTEASFSTKKKLFNLFEMDLNFQTKDFSLKETFVEGFLEQSALTKLGNLLTDQVKELNTKNQEKLQEAKEKSDRAERYVKIWERKEKEKIDRWVKKETEKLQKPIDSLKAKIKASRERCVAASVGKGRKIKACAEEVLTPGRWATIKGLEAARDIGIKGIAATAAKAYSGIERVIVRGSIKTEKLGIKVAQRYLKNLTEISVFLGKLLKRPINIESVEIRRGTLDDLIKKGKFSEVVVKGFVLGRRFCQVYEIDLKNPKQFINQIAKGIVQIFGPKKYAKAISDQCGITRKP